MNLPIGLDSFPEIRREKYYYIDKTDFITELLDARFKVCLVTRPRRFGKTLTMTMLEDFFRIDYDSRQNFDGLKISHEYDLCREWQNQWPVVFISMKDVDGLDYQTAYGMLEMLISNLCRKYSFLGRSQKVNKQDAEDFQALLSGRASEPVLRNSLLMLTRMMMDHYGKACILLIDEYDVPLDKANTNGYYRQMVSVLRSILSTALKNNEYLKFAVLTGCLRITKESIFTGLNNVTANTITSVRFDEKIGFTEADVEKLLSDTGFLNHENEIRTWYDGYRFGNVDVYCPWDVLCYVADLQSDPQAVLALYWADTSSNAVIYKLCEDETFDVEEKFEALLAGDDISEKITENLTYEDMDASEENLWSLLFMTGYLTLAKETGNHAIGADGLQKVALRIPNEEIRVLFKQSVIGWFKKHVQTVDRTALFQALWEGDAKTR